MHRFTLYLYFITIIFMETAFLLGYLYLRDTPACISFFGVGNRFMSASDSLPGPSKDQFPISVDGLTMERLITGEEAQEYARKIYGKDDSIRQVFICLYCGGHEQALLWLFEFASVAEAGRHMEETCCQMGKSRTFRESGLFCLGEVEIFYAYGSRQSNYYYNKQNIIYWISLFNEDPLPLFLQFYQYF